MKIAIKLHRSSGYTGLAYRPVCEVLESAEPLVVDWDKLDSERLGLLPNRQASRRKTSFSEASPPVTSRSVGGLCHS